MRSDRIGGVDVALFDLDGTLVDLNFPDPTLMNAREDVTRLYADHGVEMHFSPFLGTIQEATAEIEERGEHNLAAELRTKAFERIAAEDIKAARAGAVRIDAPQLLSEFRDEDIPIGIVTNNSRAGAIEIFDCTTLPNPGIIVTRDDVQRPKPDPEMILSALDALEASSDDFLMVGDSESDVTAAHRAEGESNATAKTALLGKKDKDTDADIQVQRLSDLQAALDVL